MAEAFALSVELGCELQCHVVAIKGFLRHVLSYPPLAIIKVKDDVIHRAAVSEASVRIELECVCRRIRRQLFVAVSERTTIADQKTVRILSFAIAQEAPR